MSEKMNQYENKIEQPFGWLPQTIIEGNYNLSAKATGILLYLNNRPDGWKFYKTEIVERFSDGKTSIENGIKELKEKGFLEIQKIRNDKGMITGSKWVLDLPDSNEDFTITGKPGSGKPGAGESTTNKKYSSKTYDNKNNNTYIEPDKDSASMSIFLKLFQEYTNVEHQAVEANTYYDVSEKLQEYYSGVTKEKFIGTLKEYFEDFDYSEGRLPKLQYLNVVADRYLNY